MDVDVVTAEGAMSEFVKEAKGIAPEVAEVLAEVPRSPQIPRLKTNSTKESVKDKKGKQAAILVHGSPRRNPQKDKPTAQEKGKTINLEPREGEIEDILMDDEDFGVEVEEVEIEGFDVITKFPEYIHPRKGMIKVPKDINENKVTLHTPLLPDEIVF